MFEVNMVVLLNLIVVVTSIITLWYSIHLMAVVDHSRKFGWWSVLPVVILYGVINRVAVLICSTGYSPVSSEWISAMILPLWIGLLVFVRGLYNSAYDLKEMQRIKE